MNWIDSHNHLHFLPPGEVAEVVAAMAAAGISQAVVNATAEADWGAVATLAASWPTLLRPAFGIHPWQIAELTAGWPERLRTILLDQPLASVGECGLDRRRGGADMPAQRAVFEIQLRLGRELGRTVSIHCVKAWGELLEAILTTGPPEKFLLHAYGGSLELARRFVRLGAYFSFSPNLWERDHPGVLAVFRQLPRERLLVESDAPQRPGQTVADGRNPASLPLTGKLLATALEMSVEELAELTCNNALACFGGTPNTVNLAGG